MYYICNRLHNPDIYDKKKIIQTMKYIQLTQWLPLTLESDDVLILKWWVDALYYMHNDFRGHAGATLSLVKGNPYSK